MENDSLKNDKYESEETLEKKLRNYETKLTLQGQELKILAEKYEKERN